MAGGCGGESPRDDCGPRPPPTGCTAPAGVGKIERIDPALDALVAPTAAIEKVAGGFKFTEGPLWRPDGTLWFSDVQGNVVRSVTPDGKVTVIIENAGGASNGAARCVHRVERHGRGAGRLGVDGAARRPADRARRPDRTLTPVVSTFEGKRFNSPNDLVFAKDGALYFTDPPYGLAKQDDDPAKEITFNGVYRFANGQVQALVRDLDAAQRPGVLARLQGPLRQQLRRGEESRHALRRRRGRHVEQRARVRGPHEQGRRPGRRTESGCEGKRLHLRSRRRLGPVARRQAPRHHPTARGSCQLRMGRRWQDAVHDGSDRRLPGQDAGRPVGCRRLRRRVREPVHRTGRPWLNQGRRGLPP